ncbi:MAG: hypothetical protein QNJ51_17540 [Calothrix sp. MO_167.B12]|nr:hypothetical protein [Calothrix sp. MO_167.B12]
MLHLSDYLVWLGNPKELSSYQRSYGNDDTVLQHTAEKQIKNQQSSRLSIIANLRIMFAAPLQSALIK